MKNPDTNRKLFLKTGPIFWFCPCYHPVVISTVERFVVII